MLRPFVLLSSSLLLAAGLAGCPTPTEGEGEGESREGEGEGDPGEGEGEGDPAEGEGEGAGEGEGEGQPPDPNDEAGDESDPATSDGAPFTETMNIQPSGDRDCWSFSANEGDVLIATAIDATCAGSTSDPELDLFDATDITTQFDSDSDGGDGYCARLESVLKAGDWIICVHEWGDNGSLTAVTLSVELTQPTLLGAGETCVTGSIAAICDPGQALECLIVAAPATYECAVPETLGQDATCIPGTTAAVCDRALALQCLDPESDGSATCINPDAEACEVVTDVSGATLNLNIGTTDFTDGSCTYYTSRPETVLRYAVDASMPLQNLAFQGNAGVSALYARRSCELPASQLRCSSATSAAITVPLVEGGSEVYLFVEGTADAAAQIAVTATEVTILDDGADCVPYTGGTTLPTSACAPGLLCVDGPTADKCASAQAFAGELADTDTLWNRTSAGCTTTTINTALDRYTVTNSGPDSTLTVLTREPGDAGFAVACSPDTFVHVYAEGFNPADPTVGCRDGDDDGGLGNLCSQLSHPISSGETVEVVVSGFSATGRGDYEVLFAAPGSTLVVTAN